MHKTMLELFSEQVQTIPEALYLTQTNFGNRPANLYKELGKWRILTYNELMSRLENIALGLISLGLQPGDRVGIKSNNCARWIWADLGSMMAGAATVSLYPNLSRVDTTEVVNHSGVKFLFVESKQKLQEICRYLSDMPSLQYLICFEPGFRGNGKNTFGLGEIIGGGAIYARTGMVEFRTRLKAMNGSSPSTIVYTSGTSGELKAALFSHRDIINACTRSYKHLQQYGHTEDYNTVSAILLPVSPIIEKIHGYFSPLMIGGTLGFATSLENVLNDLNTIRPTWVTWVPRLAANLFNAMQKTYMGSKDGRIAWEKAVDVAIRSTYALEAKGDGYIDLTVPISDQLEGSLRNEWLECYNSVYWKLQQTLGGRLQDIIIGAAYMDPELQRKLVGMGVKIILNYGLSESAAGVSMSCPNHYKIGWISPPVPGVEFRLDEDDELLIRGDGIITSYYRNDQATQNSFTPDGWFRTGDIVERDEDGNIRVVDRKKSMIVLDNGKNVSQSHLEALCTTSALIDQIVIVGQDREYISALIVPNFDFLIRVLKSHGIAFDDSQLVYADNEGVPTCVEVGEDVINNELVVVAMQDQLDMINAKLKDYESVKAFRLLRHRLNEETGDISHLQKLRMRHILQKYRDLVEDMYK